MTAPDIALLEILSSKICHDLISPIGAVNNGVELIEELGTDAGPEATALIAFSARQASAKLQAFRMAYGAGGADGNLKPEDVYKTIQQIVGEEKKITQEWSAASDFGAIGARRGFCKILACVLLLAMECLPKGGRLNVALSDGKIVVLAEGKDAALRAESTAALAGKTPAAALDPKSVHAMMTGLMARHYKFMVESPRALLDRVMIEIS